MGAVPHAAALAGLLLAAILGWATFASAEDTTRVPVPQLAHDGLMPTPTPVPVPPGPLARCYSEPAADGFVRAPADADSVLRGCQVVAFYGYPGVPGLGVLGEAGPETTAARTLEFARQYDDANGTLGVIGAYHLIVAVAQAGPTADGSWLVRMPPEIIEEWIAAAAQHDFLVILDIQMGHSDVDTELAYFLPYLANPRVHLALDPEWAMPPGVAPGTIIGGMDAAAINRAQSLMSDYIAAHGLANRMLIVHQFVPQMIRDKAQLRWHPGVDLLIDTDGFGYPRQKIDNYNRYIAADGAKFGGMKLFFDEDIGLMSPADVNALVPQPSLVIYQ